MIGDSQWILLIRGYDSKCNILLGLQYMSKIKC